MIRKNKKFEYISRHNKQSLLYFRKNKKDNNYFVLIITLIVLFLLGLAITSYNI